MALKNGNVIYELAQVSSTRNQDYIEAFGRHLKSLRENVGLSQEELANRSGLAFSQIGRFERGVRSPTLSTIKALADGLEVQPHTLLDF